MAAVNCKIPERNFKWPKKQSQSSWSLAYSRTGSFTATLNYNEKLEKFRNTLNSWKYRTITLIGEIAVLKSLVVSLLVYILSPMCINANAIKEVNKLFYSFVWNGKGDKSSEMLSSMTIPTEGVK